MSKREHKLPPEKQYIRLVRFDGDSKIAIAMLHGIVKHIHQTNYLAIDFTYKRVAGSTDEWEIATMLPRYNKCMSC